MNIAVWLLQGLLAAVFLTTGSRKVFKQEKTKQQAGQNSPTKGLTVFIGLSEINPYDSSIVEGIQKDGSPSRMSTLLFSLST